MPDNKLRESLQLVERLNNEYRKENVQALRNDLQQVKQLLHRETEKVNIANKSIEVMKDKLVQAEQDRLDAIHHQKIVEIPVEKPVFYEKCRNCDQTALRKEKLHYERERQQLADKFRKKEAAYDGTMTGFILYGILITIFMAVRSDVVMSDLLQFLIATWSGIGAVVNDMLWLAGTVAVLGNGISNEMISGIVYWLLFFISLGIILAGSGAGFCFLAAKTKTLYGVYYKDKLSVIVTVVSAALAIFFGDWIKQVISINLILLLFLVQMGYVIVRWYVKGCKETRGY